MKIVIVKDQRLFREAVIAYCRREDGLDVVGEAGEGLEAMAVMRKTNPDIALIDLELPGDSGFGVMEKMAREGVSACCGAMSAHCNPVVVVKSDNLNLAGFVDKNQGGLQLLIHALKGVAANRTYFAQNFIEARKVKGTSSSSFDKLLSPREQQILGLIGRGEDNQDIAASLGLALDTVMTHRKRIMKCL